MKASELRIGNWIEWQDDSHAQFQVESITYHEPNYFVNGGLFDDMLPIPITEDWCVKLGFLAPAGEYGFRQGNYPEVVVYVDSERVELWQEDDSIAFTIEYVHQLQNLYFAITGEELTIKETVK